jgi:queuine tRNA-ribosyltransferase/7-cyano-7-deazaguanine tRNA-ribosyltransferase
MLRFQLLGTDGTARVGRIHTSHGSIETPAFVPVGTQGSVKALSSDDLGRIGTQVVIANAYHLHLQPGEVLIEDMGGLHKFMGLTGPIMVDSGGYQIFSLGAAKLHGVGKIAPIFPEEGDRGGHFNSRKRKSLVKIDEDGAEFISYHDGSTHRFTPERVVEIGRRLGADMILVLDECTSPLHDYEYTKRAMERTHRWADRAVDAFQRSPERGQALMGIVQGGAYQDLREASAAFIAGIDVAGYAIGGSLGGSKHDMHRVLEWTIPCLPEHKPRHLLGIGKIEDIFEVVTRGVDLFDCVIPTRMARTGALFVKEAEGFRVHIINTRFKEDRGPIEERCRCYTCRNHSRAYLRHLFMAKELSAMRLAAIHNLFFLESLMMDIRGSIMNNTFGALKRDWLAARRLEV